MYKLRNETSRSFRLILNQTACNSAQFLGFNIIVCLRHNHKKYRDYLATLKSSK